MYHPRPLERSRGLNGFQLKLIALVVMTIDHIYYFGSALREMPEILTLLGRIAAPIFVFMVTESFAHTRSRGKYLLRLYIGATAMRFANIFVNQRFPMPNNVTVLNGIFSTMFCIVLCLWWLECFRRAQEEGKTLRAAGYLLAVILYFLSFLPAGWLYFSAPQAANTLYLLLPMPFYCEGGYMIVLMGIGFSLCRGSKRRLAIFYTGFLAALFVLSAAAGSVPGELRQLAGYTFFMWLALPLLLLYNGERGKRMKYLFYLYYPAHVYLLAILVSLAGR